MIVLTHWIDKYFFTPIEIEGCVSWRKIEDIVCINKWCRRFCKEFDAKFFIYDGHCPKNVKLVFFKYQAIYEITISFQTTEPRTMSPIHEIATADIFDINRYSKLTKYNHDDKTFIDLFKCGSTTDCLYYIGGVSLKIPCHLKNNLFDINVAQIANLYGKVNIAEFLYHLEADRIIFRWSK